MSSRSNNSINSNDAAAVAAAAAVVVVDDASSLTKTNMNWSEPHRVCLDAAASASNAAISNAFAAADADALPVAAAAAAARKQQHHGDDDDDDVYYNMQNTTIATEAAANHHRNIRGAVMADGLVRRFLLTAVWPGLGLLGESYMLFSMGTLKPIWELLFAVSSSSVSSSSSASYYTSNDDVFSDSYGSSSEQQQQQQQLEGLFHALAYAVVTGVMTGMLLLGYAADRVGRRAGSIGTAALMAVGAAGMLAVALLFSGDDDSYDDDDDSNSASSVTALFHCFAAALFVFGVGVGGEYPLAAASASEKAMSELQDRRRRQQQQQQEGDGLIKEFNNNNNINNPGITDAAATAENHSQQRRRKNKTNNNNKSGRQVQLVFTMQGVGILLNCILLTVLLHLVASSISSENENDGHDDDDDDDGARLQQQRQLLLQQQLRHVWQILYAVGTLLLVAVLVTRILHLEESAVWATAHHHHHRAQQGLAAATAAAAAAASLRQHQTTEAAAEGGSTNAPSYYVVTPPPPPPPHVQINGPPLPQQQQQQHQQHAASGSAAAAAAVVPNNKTIPISTISPSPSTPLVSSPSDVASTVSSLSSPSVVVSSGGATTTDEEDENASGGGGGGDGTTKNTRDNHGGDDDDGAYYRAMDYLDDDSFAAGVPKRDNDECALGCTDFGSSNNNNSNNNNNNYALLFKHYGVRLFAVSASWFLWDVAFYGNKLFQSSFLLALTGGETNNNDPSATMKMLMHFAAAATLNAAVALAGYFGAALIIDHPSVGRRRLQQWGFLLTGSLFCSVAFLFDHLSTAVLVTLYLGSSFAGQLGPNATTFLIPAEIFPTEVRSVCHGIAAASGKLGALAATVLFNHVSNDLDMFLLSGYASFVAAVITFWFIPETVGLDLFENDRQWQRLLLWSSGRHNADNNNYYHFQGDPAFLSVYERHQLSRQKQRAAGNVLTSDLHDATAYF